MNLEEAYDITKLSKDEESSIHKYVYTWHTSINSLANFTPSTYKELSSYWIFPETPEEVSERLDDFVNIYSAMYKNGKTSQPPRNLYRGTSNAIIKSTGMTMPSFVSTTTDQNIAKTFCKMGDGAIADIRVDEPIPYLYATQFRSEDSKDEKEYILAPFCRTTVYPGRRADDKYSFSYYQLIVRKPELEDVPSDELQQMRAEIVEGFQQNIADIKTLNNLQDRKEFLDEKYSRYKDDPEERAYILEESKKVTAQIDELFSKTYKFSKMLQRYLKGMCRQKEVEIDQAQEVIDADKQAKKEAEEKRIAEEKAMQERYQQEVARKQLVSELTYKLDDGSVNTGALESSVSRVVTALTESEEVRNGIGKKFGFTLSGSLATTEIPSIVEQIKSNMQAIRDKIDGVQIDEGTDLPTAESISKEMTPLLDGVSYGLELKGGFAEIQDMYREQLESELKGKIYLKVQEAMQRARYAKYSADRERVSQEKVGLFGKLFGKENLRQAHLANLELKMKLAQVEQPTLPDKISIRELLADMHTCADTQLGGTFSQDMQALYDQIKKSFQDTRSGTFTEEYIKSIAHDRLAKSSKSGLPAIQSDLPKGSRAQIDFLTAENEKLKKQIDIQSKRKSPVLRQPVKGNNPLKMLADRLRGIANNTGSRSPEQEKTQQQDIYHQDTVDLWK